MAKWHTRPVLHVADVDVAVEFYGRLGFTEAWKFGQDDTPLLPAPTTPGGPTVVAQVHRDGCEIIFSKQWPDKGGAGMLFIALTDEDWAALPGLLTAGGVDFVDGWWGYRSIIVTDPDGNRLYFPDPADAGGGG